MKKLTLKLTTIVVIAGVFVVGWFAIYSEPLDAAFQTLPTTSSQDDLEGMTLVLASPNGKVDLFDTPEGLVSRFTVAAGTTATVVDWVQDDARFWYLVALEDGSQGWVPAEAVAKLGAQGPTFHHFAFCEGDVGAPNGECGNQLSLDATALWLRWDYTGLTRQDVVQHILIVDGERYHGQPMVWDGPATGQHLMNLLDLAPRRSAGLWTVWFVVNGEFAGATSVRMD